MKIAIVTELYLPSIGGQQVRYAELGKRLAARGHAVDVFTIAHQPGLPAEEHDGGVRVVRLVSSPRYQRKGGLLSRDVGAIVRFSLALLARLGTLRGYDLVLFNQWPVLPQIVCGPLLGRRAAVDWCEIRSSRFWTVLNTLMARSCRRHLCVSEAIGQVLVSKFGRRRDRVAAVLSGIESALYAAAPQDKEDGLVLFLGRLSDHKNPGLLLAAFAADPELSARCRLVLAGDGEQFDELKERARGMASVSLPGLVSDAEKVALLKQAALLVLPSRREGFPRVIAEAAAAGTPTVTVHYPDNGSVHVVGKYGLGWVCAPDAAALAATIREHVRKDAAWEETSRRGVEAAARIFDWEAVIAAFLGFFAKP